MDDLRSILSYQERDLFAFYDIPKERILQLLGTKKTVPIVPEEKQEKAIAGIRSE